MNYIDVKVTSWDRYYFEDTADMQAIKHMVEEESSFYEALDSDYGFTYMENLYETGEDVSLEENSGFSTIEIWEDEELIYQNGK